MISVFRVRIVSRMVVSIVVSIICVVFGFCLVLFVIVKVSFVSFVFSRKVFWFCFG